MRVQRKASIPIYAYCVLRLDNEQFWNVFPGIGDRPVFPLREAKLAMLVSRLDGRLPQDAQSIIQHGRVVHRVFDKHTVLPFRFGTTFKSEAQVREILLANRTEFLDSLNRLRGKSEMHLKVLFPSAATSRKKKKSDPEAGDRCLQLATDRLSGLFDRVPEQAAVRPLQNGEWLVDFAHLVEEDAVPAYQAAFGSAATQMKDCQLLVSGPWPPYHFIPCGIRMPAASESPLLRGRRMPNRAGAAAAIMAARMHA